MMILVTSAGLAKIKLTVLNFGYCVIVIDHTVLNSREVEIRGDVKCILLLVGRFAPGTSC